MRVPGLATEQHCDPRPLSHLLSSLCPSRRLPRRALLPPSYPTRDHTAAPHPRLLACWGEGCGRAGTFRAGAGLRAPKTPARPARRPHPSHPQVPDELSPGRPRSEQGPRVRIRSPHIRCAASKAPAPAGQGPDGFPFSLSGECVFSQREGNRSGHRISLTRGAASPRSCQPWPGTAGVPPAPFSSGLHSHKTRDSRAGAPRGQVRPVGRCAPSAGARAGAPPPGAAAPGCPHHREAESVLRAA